MISFLRDGGIPSRLRDLGIPQDALPRMALAASREVLLLGNNPKTLTVWDIERIYRNAW